MADHPHEARSTQSRAAAPTAPAIEITTSRMFNSWLADQRASLALTTYQTAKIFLLGLQPNGRLSIFERTLERVMGMHATADVIHVSTLYQIWRFRNTLKPGETFQGYDAVYVPRESRVTGDVDVHDIVVDERGRVIFTNTLFNCLATLDDDHNFRPLWRPPWISKLAPEDRCHLNGLALRDGRPRYATAVSRSDVNDGWRDRRRDGGVVIDIVSGEVVCEGLSMPHSPRWHMDTLWLINSGTGYFGRVDLDTGVFEPLVFLPGYARGLTFLGDWAIVGPLRSAREPHVPGPRAGREPREARRRDPLRPAGRGPAKLRRPALAALRRHRQRAVRRRRAARRHPPHGRRVQDRRGQEVSVVSRRPKGMKPSSTRVVDKSPAFTLCGL